jgi:hypothetical protein
MSTSEHFKYDVRIRERMLSKGLISDKEVQSHLEALKDVEAEARPVSIPQPALAGGASADDDAPESTERP